MDLIGDNPEVVLFHNGCNTAQLLFRPHPARGVLGVAPEHHLALGICALLLKVLIVQLKGAVGLLFQGRVQHIHPCILRRVEKIAVGRSVHQHLLILVAECFRQLIQCRNDARGKAEFFFRETPVIVFLAPLAERVVIIVGIHARVPEDAAVNALAQLIQNFRGNTKFHVCHPHADKLIILVREDLFRACVEDIATETISVQGVRAFTINNFIKVIHQNASILV